MPPFCLAAAHVHGFGEHHPTRMGSTLETAGVGHADDEPRLFTLQARLCVELGFAPAAGIAWAALAGFRLEEDGGGFS